MPKYANLCEVAYDVSYTIQHNYNNDYDSSLYDGLKSDPI